MTDPTALRHQLLAAGFCPLPLRGKRPFQDDWTKRTNPSGEDIENWWRDWPDAPNTGLLTRLMPTLDADITDPIAVEAIEMLVRERFEEHGYILTRAGNAPKCAFPFRTNTPFPKITVKLVAPDGSTDQKIELLCDGQQVVVDGIHPDTRQPYRWHGGAPGAIKYDELPYLPPEEAQGLVEDIVELCRSFGYSKLHAGNGRDGETRHDHHRDGEGRHDRHHRHNDPDPELIRDALRCIPADDRDVWLKAGMALKAELGDSGRGMWDEWSATCAEKYNDRDQDATWHSFKRSGITIATLFGYAKQYGWKRPRGSTFEHAERDEQQTEQVTGAQHDNAAPVFNPWERFVAPAFPFDILPPVVSDFVLTQSEVIGGCPSGMAMATLAAVSGAANHRFSLKMMEHGQWYEHPRLWVLLVGDPSQKKTPEIDAATAPLERLQAEVYRDYKEALRQHEEAGNEDDPEPEAPPRYVVVDTTVQKLGEILARADRGLLVKRDELTGWIGDMDKYSNSTRSTSDRAFWLQSWNGGPYHVDRVGRGETFIENLSVSILGGIQPDRFAELQGLTSDGLLQRFLPIMVREASFTLDAPANVNPYWALIRQLITTPPQHLSMTDDARRKITDLRQRLHDLEKASGGIARGFQSFIGKLAGYSGRLALVLHLSEFSNMRFIGGKIAENVHRLVLDFLIPHAFEFYSLGETGDQLKRLASYILTCDKDRILASDLTTNIRDFRGLTLFQVRERVSPLIAGGWLDPVDHTPMCKAWWVNPTIKVRFAEQARKEAERKRSIIEAIRAQRMSST